MAEKNNNSQQIGDVVKVRHEKLAELVANNADPFVITKFDRTHTTKEIKENYADVEGKTVIIAGRLMAKRRMGSVSFGNVADLAGNIQIFIKKDIVGEDEYNKIKKYDIGDIVGIEGVVFTTEKGEMSIRVAKVTLLSTALKCV